MIKIGQMNKKYVKIMTTLPKVVDDVIGTPVKDGENIVGKVIAYDKETGKATIRVKSEVWKKIAGDDKGLLKRINKL